MSIKTKITGLLNKLIRHGYWYNDVKFRDCRKFWEYKIFNTEIANLGSTSGISAFCYEDIPYKCANWALSANPLKGDFAILKNYYSYLCEDGATIILPICPFSSLAGGYDIVEDRYYTLLYPSSIPAFSLRRQQQIKSVVSNPLRFYPFLSILTDTKALLRRKKNIVLSEKQMQADAQRWMTGWMKEFGITDFSYPLSLVNRDGIEEAVRILNEIISFCKERNLRPVILIPPVHHSLGELFTPDIRKKIINPMIEGIEDKTIWFHNYMDDTEFTNDISLFQNSFLMNEKGAKLFTRRVFSDIGLNNNILDM